MDIPHKPWFNHQNGFNSSLSGLDTHVPVGQQAARPASYYDYVSKALPPLPIQNPRHKIWNESTRRWDQSTGQNTGEKPLSYSATRDTSRVQPTDVSRTPSPTSRNSQRSVYMVSPSSPRSPGTPPITKSSQKILQLTGYDPRFETSLPKDHQQMSPAPVRPGRRGSDSSGSAYSQPDGYEQARADSPNLWNNFSSVQTPLHANQSQYSFHLGAEKKIVPNRSHISFQRGDDRADPRTPDSTRINQGESTSAEEIASIREMLAQGHKYQHRFDFEDETNEEQGEGYNTNISAIGALVPKPLSLRKKTKPRRISILGKSLGLRLKRVSGNSDTTSPTTSKHYNTPTSPMHSMESDCISLPDLVTPSKDSKRTFGTGHHPLKSPFPFPGQEDADTMPSPSESKCSRRLSGAMKHLSGGTKNSPKKISIPNSSRKVDGPDIPLPTKSGILGMLPSAEDVVAKAKKSMNHKSADEKRRENIKKQIVVVGVTDQSPDGRVSEWV